MASANVESVDGSHCVLCCEDIEFSACGSCDHPICLKCCLKLRMLRKENDCPVCRAQLKEVIVSRGYKSWAEKSLKTRPRQHFRNFGIYHEGPDSQAKVDELLQHKCPECGAIFKSFPLVKDHVRKIHSCYYCDICLKHLKIFTHERKCYTREALVKHRREGDLDDKSHRGHPSCKFCDDRYLDNDDLLLHLRKNHFWCHLCEKDGRQDYFPEYKELRQHFLGSHFLCEEDECLHEKYTSVFRTKIDFQAHKAQKHSNKLSKAEARQARQLDVDITFVPRQADSASVISSRDYSSLDRKNERYGGRKSGNHERAMRGASGYGGPDSFVREGSDDSRPMRHKRRDGDSRRSTRDILEDKRKDRDSERPPRDVVQDKRQERDTSQDKGRGKYQDSERVTRNISHDRRRDRDPERTYKDADGANKSKNVPQSRDENRHIASTSIETSSHKEGQDLEKDMDSSKGSNFVGKDVTKTEKEPNRSESVPELNKHHSNQGNTNKSVNSSSRGKTDNVKYNEDFPALKTEEDSLNSNVVSSMPIHKQQHSKQSTRNRKAVVDSTAEPPPPKLTYHEEFPTLSAVTNRQSKLSTTMKAPPGLPPPGLSHRPPPGLKWNKRPIIGFQVEGATPHEISKNSSGNSRKRDQQLIEIIYRILECRGQSFPRFREISGQFHQGHKTAESYYHECHELLGEENIHKVFKELVDLLPDEKQQAQLLSVYNDAKIRAKCEQPGNSEASWSSTESRSKNVIASRQVHLHERDFPALPSSSANKMIKPQQKAASAWVHGR